MKLVRRKHYIDNFILINLNGIVTATGFGFKRSTVLSSET